jgi:Tfp pilus assembly PilM family ATPase
MKINPRISLAGRSIVAVEMGGDWFKFLHVTRTKTDVKVSKLVLKPASELEGLSRADLLKVCGLHGLQKATVIACFPRQMVNVRLFDLPSGDPQEIADMIDLQIARQTPYSREEIVHDYRLIDSERDGYTRVMLMIAQLGQVRQRVRMLEELGLDVEAVTVSTDGWLGAIQAGADRQPESTGQTAYLDLDSAYGDFMVLQKGLPLFSRSIPVGARDLMADPQKQEEKLLQELSRAMETFRNETPSGDVRRLVLSGAAAWVEGLAERLQEGLKIAVTVSRSPVRVERLGEDPHLQEVSITGLLGAAAAPGELQVNLIPESVSLRKMLAVKARQTAVAAILVMAILALLSIWAESRMQRREVYLAQLNRMIKETGKAADDIDAMRKKVALVSARLETSMIPLTIVGELHDMLGNRIALSSVEIKPGDQIVCRGIADAGEDVNQLVKSLEDSLLFKNVKTTQTRKGKDGVEFEVACDMEKRQP